MSFSPEILSEFFSKMCLWNVNIFPENVSDFLTKCLRYVIFSRNFVGVFLKICLQNVNISPENVSELLYEPMP